MSCQTPPDMFSPLPLASPGFVSPTYLYSGCPFQAACLEPSDLVITVSVPLTPDMAVAGPGTGGQYFAQALLQFDLVEVSRTNQYKVKPLELVRSVAPPTFLDSSVVPVAAPAALLAAAGELPEPPPEPPEAEEL